MGKILIFHRHIWAKIVTHLHGITLNQAKPGNEMQQRIANKLQISK
jgi:hypothetical protein